MLERLDRLDPTLAEPIGVDARDDARRAPCRVSRKIAGTSLASTRPVTTPVDGGGESEGGSPKLMDRVRAALRLRRYSPKTEHAYCAWIRRFIVFHGRRHPAELEPGAIGAFLSHLATDKGVSASTQNQALAALLFLYVQILGRRREEIGGIVHAQRPLRRPIVLAATEVRAVLEQLDGTVRLMASLLYGSGLRFDGMRESPRQKTSISSATRSSYATAKGVKIA